MTIFQRIKQSIYDKWDNLRDRLLNTTRRFLPPIMQYILTHPLITASMIGSAIERYITENPGKFVLLLISSGILLAPGIVAAPLMGLCGCAGSAVCALGVFTAYLSAVVGSIAATRLLKLSKTVAVQAYQAIVRASMATSPVISVQSTNGINQPHRTDDSDEVEYSPED